MNYYNEFDPKAAAWLRELIKEGHIPNGEVDTRSIVDVQPADLRGFLQCHFFAGVGGWSLALQLAGWPSTEPVWTGSCPCQPFSIAGKGKGTEDERHLWPVFAKLIRACKPPVAFGEQVASKAGREWLAGVFADLEGMGYQRAGADLCAAGVGSPHIRQRLYWVADSRHKLWRGWAESDQTQRAEVANTSGMGDTTVEGLEGLSKPRGSMESDEEPRRASYITETCGNSGLPDSDCGRRKQQHTGLRSLPDSNKSSSPLWSSYRVTQCRDGKSRRIPVEPELFPLAHGIPNRVGLLRGSGNAIVPEVAAQFIGAFIET